MARIFIDGFESGGSDLWETVVGSSVVSSSGLNMDGDYCLHPGNINSYVISQSFTAKSEMYAAFLWRNTNRLVNKDLIAFYSDTTKLGWIGQSDDFLWFYVGTTFMDAGAFVAYADNTLLIEFYYKIADSGGRGVIKVNGITKLDYTGDTKTGAETDFNKVKLGGGGVYAYFDNLILDDAAWLGRRTKIQKILPTGAGNSTGWTPSVGANYACVDERPASDVDYVSINAANTVDTYQAADMVGSVESVKCVQIQSRTEKDGAPTPTNLQLVARSGGTDYFSGSRAVPADPKSLYNLWEDNPADSAAWEEADVNAMEIGIKSIA